jgi:hypothetical protein
LTFITRSDIFYLLKTIYYLHVRQVNYEDHPKIPRSQYIRYLTIKTLKIMSTSHSLEYMLRLYSIFENYKAFVYLNLCYNFKFKLRTPIYVGDYFRFGLVFIKKVIKPKFFLKKPKPVQTDRFGFLDKNRFKPVWLGFFPVWFFRFQAYKTEPLIFLKF